MIGLRACAGLILLVSTVPLAAQDSASQPAQTKSDQPQPKIDLPKSKVQIFSDTEGVDFSEWLELWHSETAKTWKSLIPEKVNPPELKKGVVYIRFKVLPNGQVIDMTLDGRSGDAELDHAAWGAITGSSYPVLPREFHGPYLELRACFLYNTEAR